MHLTKREEKLLSLLIEVGSLSISEIGDLLSVSRRTAYRVVADLGSTLLETSVKLEKVGKKYQLIGDIDSLKDSIVLETYSRNERLYLITLDLLQANEALVNDYFQEKYLVSNVTIIQDIAHIEERLNQFDIILNRKKGYLLEITDEQRRRLLAILSANYHDLYGGFEHQSHHLKLDEAFYQIVTSALENVEDELPFLDHHIKDYLIFLLYYAKDYSLTSHRTSAVSKQATDVARNLYADLAHQLKRVFPIDEIVYYASVLDELVIKRQDNPLFMEKFDSQFFYTVSNLIDTVSLYTKIDFVKDATLFKFLFAHLKLSLAIPLLYPIEPTIAATQFVVEKNEFLHRVVKLVVQDLFPKYIQNELEYDYVTLHFAASLRRSPDIYPVRLLLLSNERPLLVEQLIIRIKGMAPFVDSIQISTPEKVKEVDFDRYDCVLSTSPVNDRRVESIAINPNMREIISLQELLQSLLEKRSGSSRDEAAWLIDKELNNYISDSQRLLSEFELVTLSNSSNFDITVKQIVSCLENCDDHDYLANKLIERFKVSPLAIPNTGLALLHTSSSHVTESTFKIFELEHQVETLSMNFENEGLTRILLMLTPLDASESVRELMISISQSIIENHLYTEIYKAGNQEIIYQLLSKLFTDRIKQLEN